MRDTWYYRRYRPDAFIQGQKGTCRKCGEAIYFIFDEGPVDKAMRTRGCWAHEGTTLETYADQDHYPQAKEFCSETVTSSNYDECGTPVKYEDIRAENFACGRHMRKWLEEKAYRERQAANEARKREAEALEEFEAQQYQAAGDWIKENFPMLIERSYESKPRYSRMVRYTKIDVFLLKEFLEQIVEKLADANVMTPVAVEMDSLVVDE